MKSIIYIIIGLTASVYGQITDVETTGAPNSLDETDAPNMLEETINPSITIDDTEAPETVVITTASPISTTTNLPTTTSLYIQNNVDNVANTSSNIVNTLIIGGIVLVSYI